MKSLRPFLVPFASPFALLNAGLSLGGGLWLAWLGYWKLLLLGLDDLFIGNIVITFAVAPAAAVFAAASRDYIRRPVTALILTATLSTAYTYGFMTAWAVAIFWNFLDAVPRTALIPALILSYSSATAPWSYLASFTPRPPHIRMQFVANQIGAFGVILYAAAFFPDLDLFELTMCFALPVMFALCIRAAAAVLRLEAKTISAPQASG